MKADQNESITRVGPGIRCGALMRHDWQPTVLLGRKTQQGHGPLGREGAHLLSTTKALVQKYS